MLLRNKLGFTLLYQVAGLGALALTSVVIAQRYGPAGQGYLSYFRSNVDFLAAVGLFGFPQALVYMLNIRAIKAEWATKAASLYGLVVGGVMIGLGSGAHWMGLAGTLGSIEVLVMAGAGALAVLNGLYRAISLSVCSVHVFNLISVAPALLTFFGYLLWPAIDYRPLIMVIGVAHGLTAALGLGALGPRAIFTPLALSAHIAEVRRAITYGFWSFLPGAAINFLTLCMYAVLRQSGGDSAAGQFSISILFLSAGVAPLNMIVPVLFDNWAKQKEPEHMHSSFGRLAEAGWGIAALALLSGVFLVPALTHWVFGPAFQESVAPTQILLLSVLAMYLGRLASALLLALDAPRVVAGAHVLRVGITLGIGAIALFAKPALLLLAAAAWAAGEYAAMAYMAHQVHRRTAWSWRHVLGLTAYWWRAIGRRLALPGAPR